MHGPGRRRRVESEWRGPGQVQQSGPGSNDRSAGRAQEASGGARARVSRADESEWDRTRHGEAVVRMGRNRGLRPERVPRTKGLDPVEAGHTEELRPAAWSAPTRWSQEGPVAGLYRGPEAWQLRRRKGRRCEKC